MLYSVKPIEAFLVGQATISRSLTGRELPAIDEAEQIADLFFQDGNLPEGARMAVCVGSDYAWLLYKAGLELRVCRCGLDTKISAETTVVIVDYKEVSEIPLLQ